LDFLGGSGAGFRAAGLRRLVDRLVSEDDFTVGFEAAAGLSFAADLAALGDLERTAGLLTADAFDSLAAFREDPRLLVEPFSLGEDAFPFKSFAAGDAFFEDALAEAALELGAALRAEAALADPLGADFEAFRFD